MSFKKSDLRNILIGIGGFILLLVIALVADRPFSHWTNLLYVLPIFPLIFTGYTVAQGITRLDELQQKIQLEALAFSMANTLFVSFFIGLLQLNGGLEINFMWVFLIAAAFWGLGLYLAHRRYP